MEEPWCCPDNCHSKVHGDSLAPAIMCNQLSDQEVAAYLVWKCNNFAAVTTTTGQSLFHIAAATGRLKLMKFLFNYHNNLHDVEKKYSESPLHLSLHFGSIHTAVRLIQRGCRYTLNSNHMTPLDLVMADIYNTIEINKDYINDVYVWGPNTSYNLGCGHNKERSLPELHDFFYRNKVSVIESRVEKFHSVYLDNSGNAWGCGFGNRAGLDTETAVLLPRKVLADIGPIKSISTSEQHSIYLANTGLAYTCGFNTNFVLGHSQQPKALAVPKPVRGLPPLKGVCAAPYHSVFYSDECLFTCGKHYGQLGHLDERGTIVVAPRAVSAIKNLNATYQCVAASAGATVVLNSLGAVYLLSNFRCTRLTPRHWLLRGKMVDVIGGPLDISDIELKVVLITEDNTLHIYSPVHNYMEECSFSLKRRLNIYDIVLNSTGCLLSTTLGEAYLGKFSSDNPNELVLERIPHIYRGRKVSTDYHGRNMAVIQINPLFQETSTEFEMPNLSRNIFVNLQTLLETSSPDDSIHDIVFKIEGQTIAAHSYIVFNGDENYNMSKLNVDKNRRREIILTNMPIDVFRTVLTWVYSRKCPFCSLCGAINACCRKITKLGSKEKSDLELIANKLGVTSYINALKGVELPIPYFDRSKGCHDAELEAEDGLRLLAHKCILVARSQYFSAMLTHGWSETSKTKLKVPTSGRVLSTLVDFMYNATSPGLEQSDDVEFIIQVMVDADKLLFEDVIFVATHRILTLMNLRNVSEILHFSIRYHNELLETKARLFIYRNLPAILESRVLEEFSDEYLEDLSRSYTKSFLKETRKMETFLKPIEIAIIQSLAIAHPVNIDFDLDVTREEESQSKRKKKVKKPSERIHKWSESGYEEVNVATVTETAALPKLNEDVIRTPPRLSGSPKIENRMKPISPEKIAPTPENLTLLVKKTENMLLEDFPDINTKRQYKTPPKTSSGETSKKFVKISQRERRRLASVTSSDGETPSPNKDITSSPKSPWAPLPPINSSLPLPDNPTPMKAIISEEKFEKERTARMKNKPLALTQIEDKALKELEVFYNAANATDERITVERLRSIVVAAPPVWPVNRKNISL